MAVGKSVTAEVRMSKAWFREMQQAISNAITEAGEMAAAVERHQLGDGSDAEWLLELLATKAQRLKHTLEPFDLPI